MWCSFVGKADKSFIDNANLQTRADSKFVSIVILKDKPGTDSRAFEVKLTVPEYLNMTILLYDVK